MVTGSFISSPPRAAILFCVWGLSAQILSLKPKEPTNPSTVLMLMLAGGLLGAGLSHLGYFCLHPLPVKAAKEQVNAKSLYI